MHNVVRVGFGLAIGFIFAVSPSFAAHGYPRVANVFNSVPTPEQIKLLSKWDLVCLGPTIQETKPEAIDSLRSYNPDIVVIAYFPAGFVWDGWQELGEPAHGYGVKVEQNDWWLYDDRGNPVGESGYLWFTNFTPICHRDASGKRLASWLVDYIADEIISTGLWDGLFIDGLFEDPTWINDFDKFFADPGASIDADGDGHADPPESLSVWWRSAVETFLSELRARIGPSYILIGNGKNYMSQYLNGGVRENFPCMHGGWEANMFSDFGYLTMCRDWLQFPLNCPLLLCYYSNPENTLTEPHRTISYERFLRFTLTSALLGDGYYFIEDSSGDALWWEDYYDLDFGNPLGEARLDSVWSSLYQQYFHVWVRDFENATVYCNPYRQWIPFDDGEWLTPEDGRIIQHSPPCCLSLGLEAVNGVRTFSQKDHRIAYTASVVNGSPNATYFSIWSRLTQRGDTVACGARRTFLIGANDTLKINLALRLLQPLALGTYCLEVFLGTNQFLPLEHDTLYYRRIIDFDKKIHANGDSGEEDILTIYPQPGVSETRTCKIEIFDVRGRRVYAIDRVDLEPSSRIDLGPAQKDGDSPAPGVYFLTMTLGERKITKKIVLLYR